ncbi:Ig-like domain repeat protein [Pseudobutyrivibrio sp. YE44]|uniref:Ig-like domain repeat protein n=1 Tax=Pseudobutyrivibrio sp. YE44 TaxID=1520802 RepID=UPI0015A0F9A0|nr:Ig-like domain repeat protein [Pseudobutyrivibrio sp. YE44]
MKRLHKIAIIRRLVALTMLSSLLFSSTAVYANPADDGAEPSGEVVVETGNTSNDTNSSTNLDNTVSGNDSIENNSNTTTENNEEGTESNDFYFDLNSDLDEESDEDSLDEDSALDKAAMLLESKFNWGPWGQSCKHEKLDDKDIEYRHIDGTDEHGVYKKCKECNQYIYTDETKKCSADSYTYHKTDNTHHAATGKCKVCGSDFTKAAEECKWKGTAGSKLQYCEHSADGCLNYCDERDTTPQVDVKTVLVSGNASKDIEKFNEDGKEITAYNKQIKITATVTIEALNDETSEDITNAGAIKAKLMFDGEYELPMTFESFEKGVAVFTWTSNEQYEDAVSVDGLEVSYCIGEKLKDGSRGDNKSGKTEQELHYILRNINTDKAVKNLQGTVTDGAGWTATPENPWYSKNVSNHKDRLLLTWTGRTDAQIDTSSVKLTELGETKVGGIEIVTATSVPTKVFAGMKYFFFPTFKIVYENNIQYSVPAEEKVAGGAENQYQLSFKMLEKTHTMDISTYVDNTKPTLDGTSYTSEAEKLNGKYYNKAVDVSVQFKDAHLSNSSYINVSDICATDYMASGCLSVHVNKDGEHELTGNVYDLAGNCLEITDPKNAFVVDTQAPKCTKIEYKSEASRLNGKYFNKDVTVEVTVEDKYLAPKSYIKVSENHNTTLSKDIKTSGVISLPVKDEGEYSLSGEIYDLAGNCTEISDKDNEFIIDKTAPKIDVKFDNNSYKNGKYFNANRTADVIVDEKYFTEKGVDVKKAEGSYSDVPKLSEFTKNGTINTSKMYFEADGHYGFTVKVTDLAGNVSETFKVADFVIDTVAPEVTINFDNHAFEHEKYYKANRTATVVLKDEEVFENLTSAEADIKAGITVKSKDGNPTFNTMSGSKSSYTGTIVFDQDGEYQITNVEFYDRAGNKAVVTSKSDAEPAYNAAFVIDKTAPQVSVKFDNNSFQNDIYYKADRKAEITFEEKNFSKNQVTVKKNSGDLDSVPALDDYSDSGINHVTSILFNQDGRYGFTVSCIDLAGNASNTFVSDDFVIDKTAPVLEISGVEDMSANNGVVAPVISSKDVNINDYSTEITLSGSNNGTISPSITKTPGNGLFTYAIADLAREKANDDLYTLSVKLTDFAGNTTEKQIKYSVNRFGSIFVLSDATKAMVDGYYVTKPQNVVITEINVDSVTSKEVSVAFDGNVKTLKEGRAYKVSDTTNEKGWHSISYDINSSNFDKDGIYSVTVFTEDRATNKQSNQSKDAEIEFLLDKNAPSVVVSGLENGGIYEEDSHDFSVNAADTIGVTEMKVYLNDEQLASYSADELAANGGTAVLTIPSKDDYQKVTIKCTDVAGNVTNLEYNNILVSVKAEELLLEDDLTPTAKLGVDELAKKAVYQASKAIGILAILAILIIAGSAGVVVYKKKKH